MVENLRHSPELGDLRRCGSFAGGEGWVPVAKVFSRLPLRLQRSRPVGNHQPHNPIFTARYVQLTCIRPSLPSDSPFSPSIGRPPSESASLFLFARGRPETPNGTLPLFAMQSIGGI
jgi:hypothetical protein